MMKSQEIVGLGYFIFRLSGSCVGLLIKTVMKNSLSSINA